MVFETARLIVRRLARGDAPFIHELLTDPSFLRHIGDRGVRSIDAARAYIDDGPVASYAAHGFGLWLVERRDDGVALGICGLLKRPTLDDVDIGFAFLPAYRSSGYAYEATVATLRHGRATLGIDRIVAITAPDNVASIALLEKLGMRLERRVNLAPEEPEVLLFAVEDQSDGRGAAAPVGRSSPTP